MLQRTDNTSVCLLVRLLKMVATVIVEVFKMVNNGTRIMLLDYHWANKMERRGRLAPPSEYH